jgi:hypothetical protein
MYRSTQRFFTKVYP